jgi:dTMP kinase
VTRGRFITFEGGEGAGKSTQVRILGERLRGAGLEAVVTREPGGSPGAEAIRALLVTGEPDRWSAVSETLLMYAARRDHIERTIRPALERGAWVISDRFADSTRAYQGAGGQAPQGLVAAMETFVLEEVRPDLTLILDLPVEQGLERAGLRGGAEARFEAKGHAFHQRLREAFLDIARAEPSRCVVLDAAQRPEAVSDAVWSAVAARLPVGPQGQAAHG